MGLLKKAVVGTAKGLWKHGTMDNLTPATGGGLTSAVVTKQISPIGFGVVGTAIAFGGLVKESFGAAARRRLGSVTYQDGPTRMTNSFTSGAVPAMMKASKGDYQAFAGMAENVVKSPFGASRFIDDFGANPAMISALYNMGGR